MKQFLCKTILLSSTVVILLLIGEYAVRQVPNPYKYKHQWMLENAENVQTLILGSSHTYFGINPEKFSKKTFSLANTSQNYEYDYYLLNQYIEQCTKLESIIIPVSYFSLFSSRFEDREEWWYAINYKIYMDCNIHSDFSRYNFELAHPSVYRGKMISIFSPSTTLGFTDYGMGTTYSIDKKLNTWEDSEAAISRHTAKNLSLMDKNLDWLHKIIEVCKEKEITLTLITTPTWHTYYNNINKIQLSKTFEIIDSIQKEHPFVKYYNFLSDNRFVADDFYDCDHLSNIGADKFSKILNELLSSE